MPRTQRTKLDAIEQDRLENAGRLNVDLHDELEQVVHLASRMPSAARQREALALGLRAVANRWLANGVDDLPSGLQELIAKAKLPGIGAGDASVLRAGQLMLDTCQNELAQFQYLRNLDLRAVSGSAD